MCLEGLFNTRSRTSHPHTWRRTSWQRCGSVTTLRTECCTNQVRWDVKGRTVWDFRNGMGQGSSIFSQHTCGAFICDPLASGVFFSVLLFVSGRLHNQNQSDASHLDTNPLWPGPPLTPTIMSEISCHTDFHNIRLYDWHCSHTRDTHTWGGRPFILCNACAGHGNKR